MSQMQAYNHYTNYQLHYSTVHTVASYVPLYNDSVLPLAVEGTVKHEIFVA